MPQTSDTTSLRIELWTGTLSQLTRAARLSESKVGDAVPFPSGYDPKDPTRDYSQYAAWRDANGAREVRIKVAEDDGFTRRLTAIDDLSELEDRLSKIVELEIVVGQPYGDAPAVTIEVSRRTGLRVRITGPDRTWTAGVRHQLEDLLRSRGRSRPADRTFNVATAIVGAFFGTAIVLAGALRRTAAPLLLLAGACIGAGALVVLYRLPALELLSEGDRPKYQRWRTRLIGGAVTLAISVLGAAIWAAIQSA